MRASPALRTSLSASRRRQVQVQVHGHRPIPGPEPAAEPGRLHRHPPREAAGRRPPVIASAPIRAPSGLPPRLVQRLRRICTARNLRLGSGLVMALFVATHLLNHTLGLISLDAMEAGRIVFTAFWHETPADPILFASILIHVTLAYYAIYRRRGWRMPPSEAFQLLLGIAIPPLLLVHVLGTEAVDGSYAYVLLVLWTYDPMVALRQAAATLVVWGHACIGLHYWLRLKSWYGRVRPWLYAGALLLPALALLGFVSAGREVARLDREPGWRERLLAEVNVPAPEALEALLAIERWTLTALGGVLFLVLAARGVRSRVERRRRRVTVRYPGGREVRIAPGATILEASRANGIPHASVCGGRSRCSTCRIRIDAGRDALPPASPEERKVLERVDAPPNVRLACQLRPAADVSVTPLLPPNAGPRDGFRAAAKMQGEERTIAVLFADIRGFTGFSETKLPYDVVFVLNRYFRSMGEAIEGAGGRVDKFIGDGIMALFGIDAPPAAGAAQALAAARGMAEALDDLNRLLASDLPAPLRIGIGVHVGPAIVGAMGYAEAVSVTAVGDTVNTASRLESMTKEFAAQLVVSADLAEEAGADLAAWRREAVPVRGRKEPLTVFVVDDARDLPAPAPRAPDGR